jgi:tRNA threonylcarbamoyladenosine biosynthesis protein TsaE
MNICDKLRQGVVTSSAGQTRRLAADLARALPPVATLALHGDLGVGKTTFVQGLARGFGVSERVTSPTFSIYSVHRGGTRSLVHLDAYRLENDHQVESLLLEDFLVSPYCLAIEWPEKISGWIPVDAWHLTLAIATGSTHRITLR